MSTASGVRPVPAGLRRPAYERRFQAFRWLRPEARRAPRCVPNSLAQFVFGFAESDRFGAARHGGNGEDRPSQDVRAFLRRHESDSRLADGADLYPFTLCDRSARELGPGGQTTYITGRRKDQADLGSSERAILSRVGTPEAVTPGHSRSWRTAVSASAAPISASVPTRQGRR